MPYEIAVKSSFWHDLFGLQQGILKTASKKIKVLERDPISANGDAKKLEGFSNIYRVKVGDNYRIVYGVSKRIVQLYGIGHRNKIYNNLSIPEKFIPLEDRDIEDAEGILASKEQVVSEPMPSQDSTPQDTIEISENILKQINISEEHWAVLTAIKDEDELMDAPVPVPVLQRLIERLYPRSIDQVLEQPSYILHDIDDLSQYCDKDVIDLLLWLDPEQERLLDVDIDEPILVRGGPGTGKSIMAIYHIKRLVDQGKCPILLATHSSSFSAYAKQLTERLLGQSVEKLGIEIKTIESLVCEYFYQYRENPDCPSNEMEMNLLKEAISICKSQIPRNVGALKWNISHDKVKRLGYDYILEEIQEVIESCCLERADYLTLDRRGRRISIGLRERNFLWNVTQVWHSLLREKSYFTKGLINAKALELAQGNDHKKYQYLVIDEAQDLSPVRFKFLLELIESKKNVYVTADEAQAIYTKGFSWREIYNTLNTKKILNLNYNFRNTEQISSACSIILENANDNPARSYGERPLVVEVDDIQEEVRVIKEFFRSSAKQNRIPLRAAAILCPNKEMTYEYARLMNQESQIAKSVWGGDIDFREPFVKVLTLADAKGLEFPFVAIAGMHSDTFPGDLTEILEEEREVVLSQKKRMLYVGCSRATRALLVTKPTKNPSEFIDLLREPLWEQRRSY